MRKKKTKKESGEATGASVQEEMAKPRMAKSAREEVCGDPLVESRRLKD
jgi:hypothetical protein